MSNFTYNGSMLNIHALYIYIVKAPKLNALRAEHLPHEHEFGRSQNFR